MSSGFAKPEHELIFSLPGCRRRKLMQARSLTPCFPRFMHHWPPCTPLRGVSSRFLSSIAKGKESHMKLVLKPIVHPSTSAHSPNCRRGRTQGTQEQAIGFGFNCFPDRWPTSFLVRLIELLRKEIEVRLLTNVNNGVC